MIWFGRNRGVRIGSEFSRQRAARPHPHGHFYKSAQSGAAPRSEVGQRFDVDLLV